jgi:hypothetical protein
MDEIVNKKSLITIICRRKRCLLYDQIGKQCWNLDTTGDHTIKSECITIDKVIFSGVSVIALLLWKSLMPYKIEVFL